MTRTFKTILATILVASIAGIASAQTYKGAEPALPNQETMVLLSKKFDNAITVKETFEKWMTARAEFFAQAVSIEKFACTKDENEHQCERRFSREAKAFYDSYYAAMSAHTTTGNAFSLLYQNIAMSSFGRNGINLTDAEDDTFEEYKGRFYYWTSWEMGHQLTAREDPIAEKLSTEAVNNTQEWRKAFHDGRPTILK